jgi:hypothetical protein
MAHQGRIDVKALIREAHELQEQAKAMREKSEKLIARAEKLNERVLAQLQKSDRSLGNRNSDRANS